MMALLLKKPGNISENNSRNSLDDPLEIVPFETELGWLAVAFRNTASQGPVLLGLVLGYRNQDAAIRAVHRHFWQKPNRNARLARVADIRTEFVETASPSVKPLIGRLQDFAAGEPVDFGDVQVDSSQLTPFTQRVQAACRAIPWGQTRTYGQLAAECGSPSAARAVGSVMAKNRFPLVVPCHRVVGAGGHLGGFSAPGGLATKRRLLALEGA